MPDLKNFDLSQLDLAHLVQAYAIPWGTKILTALAIFIIGRLIVRIVVKGVEKVLTRRATDDILKNFIVSIVRWVLLLFVIIAALSQLGIDTTSLVALLGAAGLAVGMALKDSLQNFAAGVLLITFRPFTKGDFVEVASVSGKVDSISIFTTILTTPDNKLVIVPNGDILTTSITNYSAMSTRRLDLVYGISYDDDIRKAKTVLKEILEADERVLKDPAPVVALHELADSSVNFIARPWVKSSDYWPTLWDINEQVKLRFDEEGISIPYPQMDMYVYNSNKDGKQDAQTT
ncbi:MAG: mechanosensitive ion channel protein MscS [Gammaproteobacteria bacterium]|nr:MAG: mechanosensitive ion channel protein MscS [Gammaproteobacteria bacterium]